jgi:hypothetical protein
VRQHPRPIMPMWKKTKRDQRGLLLVAQQKFTRIDTLGEWWAPGLTRAIEPPKPRKDQTPAANDGDPGTERKSQRGGNRTDASWPLDRRHRSVAVERIVRRWVDPMGFAEMLQPWAGQPSWLRITQRGLQELRLAEDDDGNPYWTEIPWPEEDRLRDDGKEFLSHYHRINQVRLALARGDVSDIPIQHTWHSEREIEAMLPKKVPGVQLPHKTDGYLELNVDWTWEFAYQGGMIEHMTLPRGSRIAIEVELSRKRFAAYAQYILPDLLRLYDFAMYFATKEAYDMVVAVRRDSLPDDDQRKRIRIILLQ